jgi:hypothetical protein
MLVPAMAFSWWLASLPMKALPARAAAAAATTAPANAVDPSPDDPAGTPTTDDDDSSRPVEAVDERSLYRGLVTPEIARVARTFLDLPMGTERQEDVEGHRFIFVLERHYHPPGFVGAPTGWHKGVTVYEVR